jgi:hypothetical protein
MDPGERLTAAASGPLAPLAAAAEWLLTRPVLPGGVVLVEGVSDRRAVEAAAARLAVDLDRTPVLAMGGVTNIGHFLTLFGPEGLDVELIGLCDERELPVFQRALDKAGPRERPALHTFVCVEDLEDELIRALGTTAVLELVEAAGELIAFQTLQKQPFHTGRPVDRQLLRFMGTMGGRKIRYAPLLVDALPLADLPRPLRHLLDAVSSGVPAGHQGEGRDERDR